MTLLLVSLTCKGHLGLEIILNLLETEERTHDPRLDAYQAIIAASGDFQALPDDVMTTIVRKMDQKTKLSAALTCKRFNEILNEKTVLSELECFVNMDTIMIPNLIRRYQIVTIKNLTSTTWKPREDELFRFFEQSGNLFRIMKFQQCSLSESNLAEYLELCPNVTSLTFDKSNIWVSRNLVILAPRLDHLTQFSVENHQLRNFSRILVNVTTLEDITIKNTERKPQEHEHNTIDLNIVKSIISSQRSLKKLFIASRDFFSTPFDNCLFQLESLVLFVPKLSFNDGIRLLNFVIEQRNLLSVVFNVKCIYLAHVMNGDPIELVVSCLRHIFAMCSLKKLMVVFYDEYALIESFPYYEIVNRNVTDLYLSLHRMDHHYQQFIESTVRMFPDIKTLRIVASHDWSQLENTSARTFESINSLEKLELIMFENINSRLFTNLKPPSLKVFIKNSSLHQCMCADCSIESEEYWQKFFSNNPNLSSFQAKHWS